VIEWTVALLIAVLLAFRWASFVVQYERAALAWSDEFFVDG
jgi:hypothetical protein